MLYIVRALYMFTDNDIDRIFNQLGIHDHNRSNIQFMYGEPDSPFRLTRFYRINKREARYEADINLSVLTEGKETTDIVKCDMETLYRNFYPKLADILGNKIVKGLKPFPDDWYGYDLTYARDIYIKNCERVINFFQEQGFAKELISAKYIFGNNMRRGDKKLNFSVYKKEDLLKLGNIDYLGDITDDMINQSKDVLRVIFKFADQGANHYFKENRGKISYEITDETEKAIASAAFSKYLKTKNPAIEELFEKVMALY